MELNNLCERLFETIVNNIPADTEEFKFVHGIDGITSSTQILVLDEQGEWVGGDFGGIGYQNTMLIHEFRENKKDSWVRLEITYKRNGDFQVTFFDDNPGVFDD